MSESIVVEHLSKQFTIGPAADETMLREQLVRFFRNPLASVAPPQRFWALRDVSFQIKRGEVVGIIGRNGAGKSTLLKILSKISYPTSGVVKTSGRIASLLEVGTGFHDELTGRENVYLNGSILGMKKREVDTRLDAIVAFAEVGPFIDTPIKHYSSGMRLRLGFAVAAHLESDVLIVDEVLAVGDAGFRKKCLSTMEDLHESGRTVLVVSHSMGVVEGLCSRVIWLDGGEVRMDGGPSDVVRAYMKIFDDGQGPASELDRIEHRRGSGEVRFTRLEYLSTGGDVQPITRTGDSLVMRLHYAATRAVPRPSIGFRLYTELGTLISSSSTWFHNLEIPHLGPGEGHVDVEIASVNLVPGNYTLSLWISDGPHGSHVYDGLDHCARLTVEQSNLHGSGRELNSSYGIVYFPQTWDLRGIGRASGAEPAK